MSLTQPHGAFADIARLLREARTRKGLEQIEVVTRLHQPGLSHQTLSAYETGERTESMRFITLRLLLIAYDVSEESFFAGKLDPADGYRPDIGLVVRELRRRRSESLADVARGTRINDSVLSLIERDPKRLRLRHFRPLARHFGLTEAQLVSTALGVELGIIDPLGPRVIRLGKRFGRRKLRRLALRLWLSESSRRPGC